MIRRLFPAILFGAIFAGPVFAQETSYDRYGPIWTEGPLKERPSPVSENFQAAGKHFLVYPFEFVRWPIDRTLTLVEKYHVDDKVDWIYDQMKAYGVTPRVRSLLGGDSLGGGFDLDLTKLSDLKDRAPNSTVSGSGMWTLDAISEYNARVLQEQIGGTGFRLGADFKYENRGEEHFYGIGPNTSLGDGTSYRMERTRFGAKVGYAFSPTWAFDGKFAFENANITNGEDGGRGIIDEIFVRTGRQPIPGLGGDEILSWGIQLEHDDRDHPELPTQGGYERLQFSFHKGLDSSTGFFKYRGEAAHFFRVFSERRVLALHGVVEHHDETGDREVPFFEMSRLGGHGTGLRYGDPHRGFRRDRFYDESLILLNAEYRWTIWEYRDWRMDAVLFWDEGQVFGEWSELQLDDFRASYGLGFRVSLAEEVLLTLEIGRSHEGAEFYVRTRTPF